MRLLSAILMSALGMLQSQVSQSQSQPHGWTSVSGSGFNALMPGEPKPSTVATETSRGMVMTHIVSSIGDNKNEYLIAWTEYTEPEKVQKSPVTLLERAGRALIESKSGTLISESEISLSGYPARAFVFEGGDGRQVSVRFYLVKNRIYQVQVEIAKGSAEKDVADRFLNSFRLV